ncbi:MAG: hypothetical protein JO169_15745 [Solirubrobacterales bacterium]|nr:hypothetical protein [Solirubrobacterales bacterium]
MHARVGRVSFSSEKADEVVDHVRETIVPKYEQSDGFKGFTLLLDRAGGHGMGISCWDDEDSMHATDDLGDQARSGAAEAGGGSDEGVAHYEVLIDKTA